MKKFCILFLGLFIIILTAIGTAKEPEPQNDYLRIHIRANSNAAEDQSVKYLVRDAVVNAITPWIADCSTKAQAVAVMKNHLSDLDAISEKVLLAHGYLYGAHADIRQEEFPTRVYDKYTLEAGVYDALIIELGTGTGDNWWCCIYPPLCFTATGEENIKYRSKLIETVKRFFEKEESSQESVK